MKKRRILVIGGLAAGPSAAAKAARTNPNADVTLFEASETISYGICETPYVIGGALPDEEKLVVYTPERIKEEKRVEARILHVVEKITPSKKTILVRDLRRQSTEEYAYDRLIIATGTLPRHLNIDHEDARNVFHLNSRNDAVGILNYLRTEKPARAIIIGGGYIGMEMAEALQSRGLDVTIVHRSRLPMAGLEQDTRERVLSELEKNKITFIPGAKVEALVLDKSERVRHVVTNRGTFEVEMVILSVGVEPNVSLARSARIRLGPFGGILTNGQQQTNIEDIYAAGDCCEVKSAVTGKTMHLPLATLASKTGWVAGENAAGGRKLMNPVVRAIAVKIFDLAVAHVGAGSDEARRAGFPVLTEAVTAYGKIGLFPDAQKLTIRLIFDQRTQRLLGANLYGGEGTILRADTLSAAIQHRLTIDDLSRLDLIYTPPFAPLWDPIIIAANQAKKKL
jgi:NADPH-dependent 2,4-dienoyl-CoA reductase/sulfur reductase-like enzyme